MKYPGKKPRYGEAFHEVLIQRATSPRTRVANRAFIRQEGKKGLQLLERLRSYSDFLDGARRHKNRSGRVSVAFEQEVLSQARQAMQDGYAFIDISLKLTKHLKHVGIIDDLLDTWREALGQVDEVHLLDLWQDAFEIEGTAEALAEVGLSQATINQLTSAVETFDVSLMLQEGEITFKRNQDGRVSRLARPAEPGRAHDVVELLFANQFDAVVSAVDQSGVVPVDVIGHSSADLVEEIDLYNAILATAIEARAGLTRHVRRLEHTGLAAYEGGDPVTIIALVGLAMFIIGFILNEVYDCGIEGITAGGGDGSGKSESLIICVLSLLLMFGGLGVLGNAPGLARASITSYPTPDPSGSG